MSPETAFGSLAGRVVHAASGDPVAEARVRLFGGIASRRSTVTDADGRFRYNVVSVGEHELLIEAGGSGQQRIVVYISAGKIREAEIPFGPNPGQNANQGDPQVTLTGRIWLCSRQGRRLLDGPAQLLVYDPDTGDILADTTVPEGRYSVTAELPAGTYIVQVEGVPGYRAAYQSITVPPPPVQVALDFHLLPGDHEAPPIEDPGRCPETTRFADANRDGVSAASGAEDATDPGVGASAVPHDRPAPPQRPAPPDPESPTQQEGSSSD